MSKEVCVLDLDDVLSQSAAGWVAFSHERWGHNPDESLYREEWSEWWGVSHEETKIRNDILWAEGVAAHFKPVEGVREGVARLAARASLYVVTSRPVMAKTISEDWISREIDGDNIQEVIFSGAYDAGSSDHGYKLTKTGILQKLGATLIIDDQPKHCNGAAAAGIEANLFGSYPWNRNVPILRGVTPTPDWATIVEREDARAA